jgi:hypothetical protein
MCAVGLVSRGGDAGDSDLIPPKIDPHRCPHSGATPSLVFTECWVVLVFFRFCTRVTVNNKCLKMLEIRLF